MLTKSQIISRLNKRIEPISSIPQAAVFIPLVEINNKMHLLFQVRSSSLSWQPGDICFPGGRVEPTDCSTIDTALRETQEELGLTQEDLIVYKELPSFIASLGLQIHPVIGEIIHPQNIHINAEEVAEVFYVPIKWLLNHTPKTAAIKMATRPDDDFPFNLVPLHTKEWQERASHQVLFYTYQNYVIWGLTAQILKSYLDIIR